MCNFNDNKENFVMEKFGYVMATKMLVDGRRKVRFMYRETPDGPQDSGWRFFCGDEDNEYVNNPENIGIYDINTLLGIDKSILPYLQATEGSAFEREDENACFTMSQDIDTDRAGE